MILTIEMPSCSNSIAYSVARSSNQGNREILTAVLAPHPQNIFCRRSRPPNLHGCNCSRCNSLGDAFQTRDTLRSGHHMLSLSSSAEGHKPQFSRVNCKGPVRQGYAKSRRWVPHHRVLIARACRGSSVLPNSRTLIGFRKKAPVREEGILTSCRFHSSERLRLAGSIVAHTKPTTPRGCQVKPESYRRVDGKPNDTGCRQIALVLSSVRLHRNANKLSQYPIDDPR